MENWPSLWRPFSIAWTLIFRAERPKKLDKAQRFLTKHRQPKYWRRIAAYRGEPARFSEPTISSCALTAYALKHFCLVLYCWSVLRQIYPTRYRRRRQPDRCQGWPNCRCRLVWKA